MRVVVVVMLVLLPAVAWAHAFPDHSEPRVGHTVEGNVGQVRIWFDGQLEPLFSTLQVEDASGRRVDKGDARVDPADNKLLQVGLPPSLPAGKYRAVWSVVARDGHRTEGAFPFRIK